MWLSTGYGKSLCHVPDQLLPFLFDFKLRRTEAIATVRSMDIQKHCCCSCFSPCVLDGGPGKYVA